MTRLVFFPVFALILSLLSITVIGAAVSNTRYTANYSNIDAEDEWLHSTTKRDDAVKVLLRILPLGASITWGLLSSSGNGYRKPLRDKFRFQGWEVNMVGSKDNGTMKDNVRAPSFRLL